VKQDSRHRPQNRKEPGAHRARASVPLFSAPSSLALLATHVTIHYSLIPKNEQSPPCSVFLSSWIYLILLSSIMGGYDLYTHLCAYSSISSMGSGAYISLAHPWHCSTHLMAVHMQQALSKSRASFTFERKEFQIYTTDRYICEHFILSSLYQGNCFHFSFLKFLGDSEPKC
jgi:hypothetical protein